MNHKVTGTGRLSQSAPSMQQLAHASGLRFKRRTPMQMHYLAVANHLGYATVAGRRFTSSELLALMNHESTPATQEIAAELDLLNPDEPLDFSQLEARLRYPIE